MKTVQMMATTRDNNAVDAYASRVLEFKSPPEACIDSSLGPYVTALLRGYYDRDQEESLMELLQEHCGMSRSDAESALKAIATAVRTGVIPAASSSSNPYGSLITGCVFGLSAEEPSPASEEEFPPLQPPELEKEDSAGPLNLIPGDLLGLLDEVNADNESTEPTASSTATNATTSTTADTIANVECCLPPPSAVPSKKKGKKGKKASTSEAKDLAASLFRPSRAPSHQTTQTHEEEKPYHASQPTDLQYYPQQQWDSSVEILLSMNAELSEEAASEAVRMANTDINVAQYIVDCALSAPPVCRHLLNEGCYRSDCHFSHDVEGHTCLFWLRGRCGKGENCRFLHGFSPALLEGIHQEFLHFQVVGPYSCVPAPYGNASEASYAGSYGSNGSDSNSHFQPLSSSWEQPSGLVANRRSRSSSFSFADIASKGYDDRSSFSTPWNKTHQQQQEASTYVPTMKIPQDVWNPHENRDSSVFYIADPMERYRQVSATVRRGDVIDLHFQSTKTFGVVLATVLPEKLCALEHVWIVTGSGHHVAKSHQRAGGALETAVLQWLANEGYDFCRGRDRNGHGGAIFVNR